MIAALLSCNVVLAQNTTSPYTVLGIGDLNSMALSNNVGMGGIGIATPSVWHINSINPALLPHNSLTVFEIGLEGESRTIINDLNEIKVGTGGFKYLSFAFPIIPGKWTSNIGYMPYSSVNYKFTAREAVQGVDSVDAVINFQGTGGLNQVYFSNGVDLGSGISLGLRMSYVFGLIEAKTSTLLDGKDITQQFPTGILEKTNYSGFTFGLGAAYRKTLANDQALNFGLTYDLNNEIGGERLVRLERQNFNGSVVPGDTLVNNEHDGYQMPGELGLGFSWEKLNKLTIGLDVKRSFWERNAGFSDDAEVYRNTWSAAVGLEYTPEYNDVDSYIKRIKYRIGFNYQQMPNVIGGETINDVGINIGWSLPVKGVSAINMALKYGQRGESTGSLVKERYYKFVFGATINDRWFVRRKYN